MTPDPEDATPLPPSSSFPPGTCLECKGNAIEPNSGEPCRACNGTGQLHDSTPCHVLFAPEGSKFHVVAICACDITRHCLEHGKTCGPTCPRIEFLTKLWHPEDPSGDAPVFRQCVHTFADKILAHFDQMTHGNRIKTIGLIKNVGAKIRLEKGLPPAIEV